MSGDSSAAELAHLDEWKRRDRRRIAVAVALPLVAAGLLGWWGQYRIGGLERGIEATAQSLGLAGDDPLTALGSIAAIRPELERLRAMPAELDATRGELERLARALDGSRTGAAQAEARAAELDQALAQSRTMLLSVEQQRDALVASTAGLRRDVTTLAGRETELQAALSAQQEAAAEREVARAETAAATGRLRDLEARLVAVTGERERLRQRLGLLESEIAEARALRATADANAGEAAASVERLTSERDRLLAGLAAADDQRAVDAESIASLRRELEGVAASSAARETELSDRLAEAEAGRRSDAERAGMLARRLTEALAGAEADARRAAETALGQTAELTAAIEAERTERQGVQSALAEAASRLGDLELMVPLERAARVEAEAALVEAQARLAAPGSLNDVERLTSPEPEAGPPAGERVTMAAPAGLATAAPSASASSGDPLLDRLRHGGMVLGDSTMFASGEAELTAAGRRAMRALADGLNRAVAALPEAASWSIHIEGHTDDQPVPADGRWSSNWALSAARAGTIAEYLIGRGFPSDRLVAAGLADTRPMAAGDSPQARSQNRRIEMRLVES